MRTRARRTSLGTRAGSRPPGRAAGSESHPLLKLQQQVGNAAVTALVQRSVLAQRAPGEGGGAGSVVRQGSEGADVKRLQAVLIAHGLLPVGSDDGDFGPKTDAAVRAFQRSHNLDDDGIVGKSTWAALVPSNADLLSAAKPKETAATTATGSDPKIEKLNLSTTAKTAAYALKAEHPTVSFTSGKRGFTDQARAMASNVVHNRKWIIQTYAKSAAILAMQKWVDDHPEVTDKKGIQEGLTSVMDGLSDSQKMSISRHLTGNAFDVQPVEQDAAKIKATIRGLPGLHKFLEKEGGLVRWHAQF